MNLQGNKQRMANNFSIFNYYTDNSMYIHQNKCNDSTPPYVMHNSHNKNVEIESDLRGITRYNSNCASNKYNPQKDKKTIVNNIKECPLQYKILPNQYIKTNKKC